VLRAVARAIRIYKTDKDAAIKALSRFMKLEDRDALDETRRMNVRALKDVPSPAVAGIKIVKDFVAQTDPQVAKLNVDSIIVNQFADRLRKELGK
jgi:hypothetical protein